ncbi:signal peptidase II [Bacillus alveayuensis]|uniref:Lipoprotein signal peptidase n=1 Tax=Aeribacillus alveayuensis TaxID=279215 RepID=A0ABT9VL22_9BACI|nr:signal peptidase II [Bacillus alveayuensis]
MKNVFYYIIALFIILLDQWTKWIIVQNLKLGESLPIIDGFLYITSHRNKGAAWGILQGQMGFFYVITIIVIVGIIYYMQKYAKREPLMGIALAFMLGGAVGNFIDRLFRKEVVDFINTFIFSYDFPIFNIADAALTIGVLLLFIYMIFFEGKLKKE